MADQVAIVVEVPQVESGSSITAKAYFRNRATSAASTPSSVRYRVDCLTNGRNVVNWTSVTPAGSYDFEIPGTLNGIVDTSNSVETRQITVEIDSGSSTQVRSAATWRVKNILLYEPMANFEDDLQIEPYYPRTDAERTAGVTLTNYQYEAGWVERYGADPTGVSSSTTAINAALSCNQTVYFGGTGVSSYLCSNLTQTHDFQNVIGLRTTHLNKNANGALLTSSGDDTLFQNIDFRDSGDAYTGKGLVCSGDRVRVEYCGGYRIEDTALEMTGAAAQVIGTCNIWYTRTGAGYDISIGVSGTATLYHRLTNIYTSAATGGIRFIDCGSQSVVGSQFGKLFIDAGTSPAGVNGGTYTGNRINGDVTVEISNSNFASNLFSAITITLAGGTSGHRFGASNGYDSSCVITDNSVESTIVDTRVTSLKTYTPTWSSTGTPPSLGNGTLIGRYFQIGKLVHASIRLIAGSTTTFGTGAWSFTGPATPAGFGQQVGSCRVEDSGTNFRTGVAVALGNATTAINATIDSDTSYVDYQRPMTWATGDSLYIDITYMTD